jgi:hypothetical protein
MVAVVQTIRCCCISQNARPAFAYTASRKLLEIISKDDLFAAVLDDEDVIAPAEEIAA